MSDKVYVGNRVSSLEVGEPFEPISRVTFHVDEEHSYTAGDDTGRHLEYDMPWATQEMVDNVLKNLYGFVYRPFKATDAMIDPAAELGDGATINGQYFMLAQMTTRFDAKGASDIGAPGEKEMDHEYPRLDPVERELKRRVKLGQSYQGARIDRRNGLTIVEVQGDGTEGAKVVLNSKELSFYNATGGRVLYFDPGSGTYKFTGELNVADNFIVDKNGNVTINGSLTLTGTSNWLQTRYSTNKNASVPFDWQEAWNEAWSNTSTQVWAIYSYNGGKNWTQPMLAQGKDGARGATGPKGSDANIPDWVKAYTASAEFNTLVTDQWVVSMNLFGSKIFGGEFMDLDGKSKLVLNPTGSISKNADLNLYSGPNVALQIYDQIVGAIDWASYGIKFMSTGQHGVFTFSDWDFSEANVKGLYYQFS